MGRLGLPELAVVTMFSMISLVPLAGGVWAMILLYRIRSEQQSLRGAAGVARVAPRHHPVEKAGGGEQGAGHPQRALGVIGDTAVEAAADQERPGQREQGVKHD